MHGSETWPMKVEHESKMNRTYEYDQMDVWVKLNERKKSEEIRELLRLESVSFDDQKELVEMVWTC